MKTNLKPAEGIKDKILWIAGGAFVLASIAMIVSLIMKINIIYAGINMALALATFVVCLPIWYKPPKMDSWFMKMFYDEIKCETINYHKNSLLIDAIGDYDTLVQKANRLSDFYHYTFDGFDEKANANKITITRLLELPEISEIDINNDKRFDIIPIGLAKEKEVSTLTWGMTKGTKNNVSVITATGSNVMDLIKTVAGHVSRYNSKLQCVIINFDRNNVTNTEPYFGVSGELSEYPFIFNSFPRIKEMNKKRYELISQQHTDSINNVKCTGTIYEIDGIDYQSDDLIKCSINGNTQITTVEYMVQAVNDGKVVMADI